MTECTQPECSKPGTAGYQKHRKTFTVPCDASLAAVNDYMREYNKGRRLGKRRRFTRIPCGLGWPKTEGNQ